MSGYTGPSGPNIGPISPNDVNEKNEKIPGFVFDIVNKLLSKNYYQGKSKVMRKDIEREAEKLGETVDLWMFDFEEDYRDIGWTVAYHKPGYLDECFETYYLFRKQ